MRAKRLADIGKVRADRLEEAAKEAKQQIMQDAEEWELADDDEGDGGNPVKLIGLDPVSRHGNSKVTRAERLAREKIEAIEGNKREEIEVCSGDAECQDTKNAKPADGRTDLTERGLANWSNEGVALSSEQQASSSADQEVTKPTDENTNSIDKGLTTRANGGAGVPEPEVDDTNGITSNENNPLEPPKPTEVETALETSADDHNDKEDNAPISTRSLDRLAFLEAMEAEDSGGVKL